MNPFASVDNCSAVLAEMPLTMQWATMGGATITTMQQHAHA